MYNKHIFFSILVSAIILLSSCGGKTPNYKVRLKTDADSASYYIGYDIGVQIAYMDFDDFNTDAMARGALDAIKNGKLEEQEMRQETHKRQMYLNMFFMQMQARASEKNLKAGEDFLEANKKKSGVVTRPSGLQYKIIKDGTGIQPTLEDMVEVVYHGTLIDGTVFDSSKESGDTVNFPVSGVVQGFSEALILMNEGAIWEVYIPSDLGYGVNVRPGGPIKPNSVLIFEIELVKVIKD